MTADLIVFGEDWGRHPSSTQHLVKRLSKHRTIWVNSIGMRRPRLDASDLGRAAAKVRGLLTQAPAARGPSEPVPDHISLLSPAAVAWPGSRTAFHINRALLGRQIRARIAAQGIERPILWASLPTALPVVGTLGERAVVYYCGDDFGALAGVDHGPVMEMERELVSRADLVLAASDVLAARLPAGKTITVPHGADISLFSQQRARPGDLPHDRPVAGFYGSVSSWIDTGLIGQSARLLPDWDFVVIGPIATDVSELEALPNVRLLGPRRHGELPAYAQNWTVSLLPFRDCPQITACNPLKLREYLATGTPIVSTAFPALKGYEDLVHVAGSATGFAAGILAAARDTGRRLMRQARVAGESWDSRAAEVERALAAL